MSERTQAAEAIVSVHKGLTTYTKQGVTHIDPWYEFVEMDSRDRKHPDGRTRWVHVGRIDSVSDTYQRGGCTICVRGAYLHVELDTEEVLAVIRERTQ